MKPQLFSRVRVVSGPFSGLSGTVVRMLHRREPASWVALDQRHPHGPHPFPEDDPRATHALIQWEDCV